MIVKVPIASAFIFSGRQNNVPNMIAKIQLEEFVNCKLSKSSDRVRIESSIEHLEIGQCQPEDFLSFVVLYW